jgi:hypothetical protein
MICHSIAHKKPLPPLPSPHILQALDVVSMICRNGISDREMAFEADVQHFVSPHPV